MNMMITKHYDQAAPAMCYTRIIDRHPYTVRGFFPLDNVETMQQKIERMLRDDLLREQKA